MKRISILLAAILLSVSAFAQTIAVKGTVTDAATGEPVAFAAVQVKGTMTGTATDVDGKFSLSAPVNATLVFSFVGYKTEQIAVGGKSVVNCALSADAQYLEDVLVVAYGTAKKESFTGSASTIKSEKLEKRTVANLTKALDGMAAGVQTTSGSGQPGASSSVIIRGYGSLNASTTPLYVVDGVPYDGNISAINPADIESMTIIKDASAGALYGSRGANGVVIVTTKRGSEGAATVNFKATVGVASRAIPRYETLDAYQWTEDVYGMYKADYIDDGYSPAAAGQAAVAQMVSGSDIFGIGEEYNPFTVPAASLINHDTGKIVDGVGLKWNDDWLDLCTDKAPVRQEYQLSIAGGNQLNKYMFSLGYLNEEGLVVDTDFQRFSGRLNVESQVKPWFKAGMNANFAHNFSNQTAAGNSSSSNTYYSNVFYSCQMMSPIYPMYVRDANNDYVLDANGNKTYDWGETRCEGASAGWNPLANLYEDKYSSSTDNLSGRTFIDLGGLKTGPLAGLKFSTNFGFDYVMSKAKTYYNPYFGNAVSQKGLSEIKDGRTFSYTFNQLLTYDRAIANNHIDFLAGHETYAYNYQYLMGYKSGYPFGGLYELASATTLQDANSYENNYRVESFFTRLNYDFADKYYLSGSFRRDGSSRFYNDVRWGNFWSIGGSWRISQEEFMKDLTFINNLTLKASYGVQGNDNLGSYYAWQAFYDLGYANAANPGAVVTSLESKELKWEKNENLNVGIEARLFDKVSASVEYYNRYTRDMLMDYPMAVSLGFSGYDKNIGNMKNSGFEITLSADIIKTEYLRWSTTWMGSTIKNKVLHLAGKPQITSGNYVIKEGETVYSFYLPESAGVDPATGAKLYWVWNTADKDADGVFVTDTEGNILDEYGNICNGKDADGNPAYRYITDSYQTATTCKKICGSRMPALYGSWSNDIQVGNFDISLLTTYSIGGKIYDYVYNGLLYSTYVGQAAHVDRLKAWKQPGDITTIPRIEDHGAMRVNLTADELFDASYFAIKNITIGYTLPAKALKAMNFKSVRVSLIADNIKLFSALKGMDPQYNFTGSTGYSYTPTRTVSVGLDLNF